MDGKLLGSLDELKVCRTKSTSVVPRKLQRWDRITGL